MKNQPIKRSVLKKYIRHKLMTDPAYRESRLINVLNLSSMKSARIRNNLWAIVYGKVECDGRTAVRYWRYVWKHLKDNPFGIRAMAEQAMKDGFLKPGRDNNVIADVIGDLI